MKVFKIFVDMDEEEQYLNEMAKNGYLLKKYNPFGFYTFSSENPQTLTYKIDFRLFKNKNEFEQYKTLFEDTGWRHIYGTTLSGSQYFLPKSKNVDKLDIFSDLESKAARYQRFIKYCICSLSFMIIYTISLLIPYNFKFSHWGYLTPGLWDKTGDTFWKAFLFETPLVILRFLPFIILLLGTLTSGYWAYQARNLYKKALENN